MNRVLVTGATGFVGRVLVEYLRAQGADVVGLGRGRPESGTDFIQADLTDQRQLERALSVHTFDTIIHLASLASDTGDPSQMVKVNVDGFHNLLEIARRMDVRRFLVASSISAYQWYPATKFSPPDYLPVDENHPCRPKDMYSATKYIQELLSTTYYVQYGLPAVILRLTAVVGPAGRGGGRSWRQFAEQIALDRRAVLPHYSAKELCHYVDIRDVARMFTVAADHPGAVGETFNCCGPSPTRGHEFAEIVKTVFPGVEIKYGYPWSMAQGGEIVFDMGKAERLMDYRPRYSLEDSILSIKEWIDSGGLA